MPPSDRRNNTLATETRNLAIACHREWLKAASAGNLPPPGTTRTLADKYAKKILARVAKFPPRQHTEVTKNVVVALLMEMMRLNEISRGADIRRAAMEAEGSQK